VKRFIIFLFFGFSQNLFSQANIYHPFPDSNAVWNEMCGYLQMNTPVNNPHIFFLAGDTIISGNTYKKIFTSGYRYSQFPGNNCCFYYNQSAAMIRQDTVQRKIYTYSSPNDTLLYDFNLNVGDTLPASNINYQGSGNYVSSIDSVLIGTTYRKQYHISTHEDPNGFGSWDSNYVQLIDGIGSTFGLFSLLVPPFEGGCGLNSYCENNIVLYGYPNSTCDLEVGIAESQNPNEIISISPNPSTGIFTINSSKNFQFSVYDIFGREILQTTSQSQMTTLDLTSYPQGIYFVRGKSNGKIFARKIILQ
jgi:hypothetical protein